MLGLKYRGRRDGRILNRELCRRERLFRLAREEYLRASPDRIFKAENRGFDSGVRDGKRRVVDMVLLKLRDIVATASDKMQVDRNPESFMWSVLDRIKAQLLPFTWAQHHTHNASHRRGPVIGPLEGLPIPITVEVAQHNSRHDIQVVTAILHRASASNSTVAMMESQLEPWMLRGFDLEPGGARQVGLVGSPNAGMILERLLMDLMRVAVLEYVSANAQKFELLLLRRIKHGR